MISNIDNYNNPPMYSIGMNLNKRERINRNEARITCYDCLGMLDYEPDLTFIVKKDEADSFIAEHKRLHGCTDVTKETA